MKFMSWHIGDWLSSTMDLTPTERGVYFDLLCRYYQTEAPIMRSQCERIARGYTEDERCAFDYVLANFFEEREDGFHNSRADAEIEAFRGKSEKARKSAEARWTRRSAAPEAAKTAARADAPAGNSQTERSADAVRTQCERNANAMLTVNRNPIDKKESEEKKAAPRAGVFTPPEVKAGDVDRGLYADYLKARGCPMTETAWKGILREVRKSRLTLPQALQLCAEKGWRSFRADWQAVREESGEAPASGGSQAELVFTDRERDAWNRYILDAQHSGYDRIGWARWAIKTFPGGALAQKARGLLAKAGAAP